MRTLQRQRCAQHAKRASFCAASLVLMNNCCEEPTHPTLPSEADHGQKAWIPRDCWFFSSFGVDLPDSHERSHEHRRTIICQCCHPVCLREKQTFTRLVACPFSCWFRSGKRINSNQCCWMSRGPGKQQIPVRRPGHSARVQIFSAGLCQLVSRI